MKTIVIGLFIVICVYLIVDQGFRDNRASAVASPIASSVTTPSSARKVFQGWLTQPEPVAACYTTEWEGDVNAVVETRIAVYTLDNAIVFCMRPRLPASFWVREARFDDGVRLCSSNEECRPILGKEVDR